MSRRDEDRRRPRWSARRRHTWTVLAVAVSVGSAFAVPARAQQTLFNVPSADVLEAGKLYFEEDDLWRPGRPGDTLFTTRAVVGLGDGVEGGVNLGGLAAEGRSAPTAGAFGLFYPRGRADGSPSGQAYAHAAWTPAEGTRITAGVWYATSGYADVAVTKGLLAGLEQRVASSLMFQADWFSGRNGIGYLTPGFALTLGRWVVYAGYSLKNGDSHENAALIELGVNL
jgi:hypothetical protein